MKNSWNNIRSGNFKLILEVKQNVWDFGAKKWKLSWQLLRSKKMFHKEHICCTFQCFLKKPSFFQGLYTVVAMVTISAVSLTEYVSFLVHPARMPCLTALKDVSSRKISGLIFPLTNKWPTRYKQNLIQMDEEKLTV